MNEIKRLSGGQVPVHWNTIFVAEELLREEGRWNREGRATEGGVSKEESIT